VSFAKPIFYEPPRLVDARGKLLAHLYKHRTTMPKEVPIQAIVKWLYPTKKKMDHGRYKITRPDTHNLNKLLFDVMTDLKFWHDDAQVCSEIIEKIWTTAVPGIWISLQLIDQEGASSPPSEDVQASG
jgi:Holliday junction resolvase RusA-like endonuclease